jgi:hypothetical protein
LGDIFAPPANDYTGQNSEGQGHWRHEPRDEDSKDSTKESANQIPHTH